MLELERYSNFCLGKQKLEGDVSIRYLSQSDPDPSARLTLPDRTDENPCLAYQLLNDKLLTLLA